MTARCGCPDDENSHVDGGWRDPTVFGMCRSCPPESVHATSIQSELDRLEPVMRDPYDMDDDERRL